MQLNLVPITKAILGEFFLALSLPIVAVSDRSETLQLDAGHAQTKENPSPLRDSAPLANPVKINENRHRF
jgi:hypothetical protein